MDLSAHEVDYLAQSHWHCFRYRIGEMIGLDRTRREVHVAPSLDDEGREVTPQRAFGYDTLVIAVGSQSNDFGTPGVGEHSMKLESLADARRFHARMVNACIRAHAQATPLRPEQLKVAIIGAGATGVELAELHRTAREVVAFGLDRVDPNKDIKVRVIEAADRVLPALPPVETAHLADAVAEAVPVRLGEIVDLVHALVHAAGRDLVQQRLPQMRARLVDERDVGLAAATELVAEPRRQLQAAGPAADHHDAVQAARRLGGRRLDRCRRLGSARSGCNGHPLALPGPAL